MDFINVKACNICGNEHFLSSDICPDCQAVANANIRAAFYFVAAHINELRQVVPKDQLYSLGQVLANDFRD